MSVSQLPPLFYIGLFLVYIAGHTAIGMYKMKLDKNDEMDTETLDQQKFATFAFRWFPAVYLIALVGLLYML